MTKSPLPPSCEARYPFVRALAAGGFGAVRPHTECLARFAEWRKLDSVSDREHVRVRGFTRRVVFPGPDLLIEQSVP